MNNNDNHNNDNITNTDNITILPLISPEISQEVLRHDKETT